MTFDGVGLYCTTTRMLSDSIPALTDRGYWQSILLICCSHPTPSNVIVQMIYWFACIGFRYWYTGTGRWHTPPNTSGWKTYCIWTILCYAVSEALGFDSHLGIRHFPNLRKRLSNKIIIKPQAVIYLEFNKQPWSEAEHDIKSYHFYLSKTETDCIYRGQDNYSYYAYKPNPCNNYLIYRGWPKNSGHHWKYS